MFDKAIRMENDIERIKNKQKLHDTDMADFFDSLKNQTSLIREFNTSLNKHMEDEQQVQHNMTEAIKFNAHALREASKDARGIKEDVAKAIDDFKDNEKKTVIMWQINVATWVVVGGLVTHLVIKFVDKVIQ